jgi:chromosomal replication initiation ATPase DnaA
MISMEEIINKLEGIISNIFNITIEELRDNRKLRSHTDVRSILFYFLHVKYGISFYRLSKIYNKHHSTIIRAVNKCEYLKNYDKEFKVKYHMCELQIENKFK